MNNEISVILNNIMALLNEIKQMETGAMVDQIQPQQDNLAQTGAELSPKKDVKMQQDPVTEYENNKPMESEMNHEEKETPEEEKKEEASKVKKTLVQTSSEGDTANDSAVTRIEEQNTELTDESLEAVAKAILQLAKPKAKVAKSEGSDALNSIAKSIEAIANKVSQQDMAISKILKGLGVADEIMKIEKSESVKKVENPASDVNKSLEYIVSKISELSNGKVEKADGHPATEVRKTLADKSILSRLVAGK